MLKIGYIFVFFVYEISFFCFKALLPSLSASCHFSFKELDYWMICRKMLDTLVVHLLWRLWTLKYWKTNYDKHHLRPLQ